MPFVKLKLERRGMIFHSLNKIQKYLIAISSFFIMMFIILHDPFSGYRFYYSESFLRYKSRNAIFRWIDEPIELFGYIILIILFCIFLIFLFKENKNIEKENEK